MYAELPAILVTGAGLVSALGPSLESTLAALDRGERVQGEPCPHLSGTPYAQVRAAADVPCDLAAHVPDRRMRKFMSHHAELATIAARQALQQADPAGRGIAPERTGLYAGVGLAAVDISASASLLRDSLDDAGAFSLREFTRKGLRTIHPLWSFHTLANMPGCIVSVLENIKGDNAIYTPWEDQTAFALIEAAHALHRNDIDCAVVVATDTPAHPASLVELAAGAFLNPGEIAASGAACLVLERPRGNTVSGLFSLDSLELVSTGTCPPADPLAPFLGRTIAAAPLMAVLLAPHLGLPCRLLGCGGHSFRFEVH